MTNRTFRIPHPVRATGFLLLAGVFAFAGCNFGAFNPVKGKVTVNGQPLSGGDVAFYPAAAGGSQAHILGTIGPDGAYTMTTNGRGGVPKGKYKVTINTLSAAGGPATDPSKPLVPNQSAGYQPRRLANMRYENQTQTDLTIEVPSPSYDLNLTP